LVNGYDGTGLYCLCRYQFHDINICYKRHLGKITVVIIKLQGGLGNQMFQYAAATALLKDGEKVGLNLSFLTENNTNKEGFTSRKFELGIFKNIRAYKAINAQVSLFKNTGSLLQICAALSQVKVKIY
jgi:hypothetical protein